MKPANTIDRTAELLEFFASEPEPPCGFRVRDIVQALGYAQSTSSVLLTRLTELGYLRQNEHRQFFATPRLGVMGTSYLDGHPEARRLEEWLHQVHEATGHLSFLAQRNGANLQYISFKPSCHSTEPAPRNGLMRPLAVAGSGRALLSLIAANDARRIIRRNNSEIDDEGWRVNERDVMEELRVIRNKGFARSDPHFTPGLIGFATWLFSGREGVPYAIGIAIPEDSTTKEADLAIRALSDLTEGFEAQTHYQWSSGEEVAPILSGTET